MTATANRFACVSFPCAGPSGPATPPRWPSAAAIAPSSPSALVRPRPRCAAVPSVVTMGVVLLPARRRRCWQGRYSDAGGPAAGEDSLMMETMLPGRKIFSAPPHPTPRVAGWCGCPRRSGCADTRLDGNDGASVGTPPPPKPKRVTRALSQRLRLVAARPCPPFPLAPPPSRSFSIQYFSGHASGNSTAQPPCSGRASRSRTADLCCYRDDHRRRRRRRRRLSP